MRFMENLLDPVLPLPIIDFLVGRIHSQAPQEPDVYRPGSAQINSAPAERNVSNLKHATPTEPLGSCRLRSINIWSLRDFKNSTG
jgi:hypothetical protein